MLILEQNTWQENIEKYYLLISFGTENDSISGSSIIALSSQYMVCHALVSK